MINYLKFIFKHLIFIGDIMSKLKVSRIQNLNFQQYSASQRLHDVSFDLLNHLHFNKWDSNNHITTLNQKPTNNNGKTKNPLNILQSGSNLSGRDINYKANILMIDDEEHCLSSMEIILIGSPYAVITLNNSNIAFQYIKNNSDTIDLILLDINMPGISGLELLEAIRTDNELYKIPVIIQTGCVERHYMEKAYLLGISDFIIKPYKKDQLLLSIQQALQKKPLIE